ncbi:MAG TPA: OsmC family protein [Phenylobacterium sp.]
MAEQHHHYAVTVTWTGNTGSGTAKFGAYEHRYDIAAPGKPTIAGSSDPAFRGFAECWNPEDLLVASLTACHKLWYLYLCSQAGVVVTDYVDRAEGTMVGGIERGGRFTSVTLRPEVTITPGSDPDVARRLHAEAHAKCFIANSMNFPVENDPVIKVEGRVGEAA